MSRSERIELRVSPDDKAAIAAAAALEQVTATDFVRDAVLDRVAHVRARAERTLMPAAQFDALLASLDAADDTPILARAFAKRRRFVEG
ncbi:MAG: type II toxin -antitoxin system TacA 1-like antitoxin [Sporichthyaceae bacterium]